MQKNKLKEYGTYAAKGFCIGSAMTVPGVSGGTVAIILDVYDRLVFSVASIFKDFKKNFLFLCVLGLSMLIGMFSLSKLILFLSELAPIPVRFFFIGAIVGSIPMLYRKTELKKFSSVSLIFALLGVVCVFALDLIPTGLLDLSESLSVSQIPAFCIGGVALAVSLILPGISFSHMLLVFGLYERFYDALTSFDIPFLICLGIPIAVGILAFIKLLEFVLKKYPMQSYSAILGFVIASIKDIYVGFPSGIGMIIGTILAFIAGLAVVLAVTGAKNIEQD
ncbi:MAG: DUF368 domain-containing protein [Ruminococcaceae bacterium]|nr:DUF368 domain-containing protein [Oscillospiraceae bacterium]